MAKHASHSKDNMDRTEGFNEVNNASSKASSGAKSNNPRAQRQATDSTVEFGHINQAPAAAAVMEEPKQGFFKRVFSKPSSTIIFIVIILCLIAAICCGGYVAWAQMEANKVATRDYGVPDTMAIGDIVDQASSNESVENPIDFAALQAQNPDVIAWITVPGTEVNLPVLRSEEEEDYYLRHDINKAYSIGGEAYIQAVNKADFTDPVTVIYGHTFSFNDTMFTSLHRFEDPTFFEEHDTFYVYTPDRVLTYKIVSSYEFTNELITAKDFSDQAVKEDYYKFLLDPTSQNEANEIVRDNVEIDLDKGRIVQLSTCTVPSSTVKRYMVNGVLESEQLAYPKNSTEAAASSSSAAEAA